MADRARLRALTLLGILLLSNAPPGFGQAGCSNDVPIVFRDPTGISLNNATVRNLTGSNNDDQEISLNNAPALSTNAQGGRIVISGIDSGDFPADSSLRAGFNRTTGRFWETNYANGQYVFNNRGDLDVEVTLAVTSSLAPAGGGPASTTTITPTQRNLNVAWYGGTNSLRRLRGQVRLRFEDLQLLSQPGEHRAEITVCVEISGQS